MSALREVLETKPYDGFNLYFDEEPYGLWQRTVAGELPFGLKHGPDNRFLLYGSLDFITYKRPDAALMTLEEHAVAIEQARMRPQALVHIMPEDVQSTPQELDDLASLVEKLGAAGLRFYLMGQYDNEEELLLHSTPQARLHVAGARLPGGTSHKP